MPFKRSDAKAMFIYDAEFQFVAARIMGGFACSFGVVVFDLDGSFWLPLCLREGLDLSMNIAVQSQAHCVPPGW